MDANPTTPQERFASKYVVTPDGCWEWVASRSSTGYGTFYAGQGRGSVMAHRWSYEQRTGSLPSHLDLDHLCRNRACVNPDHLEPVTTSENLLRGANVGKSNLRKTHCPKGHPYSEENTYTPPSRPNRLCRACRRDRRRKQAER